MVETFFLLINCADFGNFASSLTLRYSLNFNQSTKVLENPQNFNFQFLRASRTFFMPFRFSNSLIVVVYSFSTLHIQQQGSKASHFPPCHIISLERGKRKLHIFSVFSFTSTIFAFVFFAARILFG